MSLPSAWDELTVEDFPEGGLQLLAQSLGPRVAAEVWRKLRGTRLEPPVRFTTEYMLRYVQAHWTGDNDDQIARALGCTTRTVRNLVSRVPKRRPESLQMSLI